MLRVGSIVIRVDDLARQKAFWAAALDYVARDGDADDFVLLRRATAAGRTSRSTGSVHVQIPPRIHLDLYAEDQAAEVKRLIGPGRDRGPLGQAAAGRGLRDPRRPRGQPLLRHRRRLARLSTARPRWRPRSRAAGRG